MNLAWSATRNGKGNHCPPAERLEKDVILSEGCRSRRIATYLSFEYSAMVVHAQLIALPLRRCQSASVAMHQ